MQKREHGVVKSCKKEEIKAYSEAICNVFVKQEGEVCRNFSHPEPCSLTAILKRKRMSTVDTQTIISDVDLAKNVNLIKNGETMDEV